MSAFSHILVPYDFTGFADTAFEKAVSAKKFDSKLTLLTVIGSDIDTSGMSLSRAQEVQDEADSKAKTDLDKIKNSKPYDNAYVSVEIIHNSSATGGILSFAEKNDVDLIVMGSHGRSGFKKLIIGNVASEVLAKSACPVLIVKQHKK